MLEINSQTQYNDLVENLNRYSNVVSLDDTDNLITLSVRCDNGGDVSFTITPSGIGVLDGVIVLVIDALTLQHIPNDEGGYILIRMYKDREYIGFVLTASIGV